MAGTLQHPSICVRASAIAAGARVGAASRAGIASACLIALTLGVASTAQAAGIGGLAQTLTQTTAPVTQAVAPTGSAVARATAPLTSAAASVGSAVAPVTSAVAPVTSAAAPVTSAAAPMTDLAARASTLAAPVSIAATETVAHLARAATPVTRAAAPVTHLATEALTRVTRPAAPVTRLATEALTRVTQAAAPLARLGGTLTGGLTGAGSEALAPLTHAIGPGTRPIEALASVVAHGIESIASSSGAPFGPGLAHASSPTGSLLSSLVAATDGVSPGERFGSASSAVRAGSIAVGSRVPWWLSGVPLIGGGGLELPTASDTAVRTRGSARTRAPVEAPPPLSGLSAAAGSTAGMGAMMLLTLAGLLVLGAPWAGRRLRLAGRSRWPAPFVLMPERPG
jgi:hypothetical protein